VRCASQDQRVDEAKSGDLPEAQSRAGRSSREGARRAGAPTLTLPFDPRRLGRREFFFLVENSQLTSNSAEHRRPSSARRSQRDYRNVHHRAALVVLFSLLVALVFSACGPRSQGASGLRQITDEIGRAILVTPEPQRIVSLAPSITETLFALGLGDRIVGVTAYCDYPPEAAAKEQVGDTLRPSIERIVALKTDLVIASTASQLQQFVHNLDEVAIPVYVSDPRGVDGALESITRIGELTGTTTRARELTTSLRVRVESVQARLGGTERPRVLCILGSAPLITIGARSFITDLINQAGGRSISDDLAGDYPQYSLETAVAKRPEVIFLETGEADLPERLKHTPAGQFGRVFHIDTNLLLRPGPRIVDGLEQMARKLHPEVFGVE
jgi:iron complex transport system substrate-binding protein